MTPSQLASLWPYVVVGAIVAGIAFGIAFGLVAALRENDFNKKRSAYLDARDAAFKQGYLPGRQWLAEFIAEAEHAGDPRDHYLRFKSHPARKSAEIVREVKLEKRALQVRVKFLEYQLKSYEEYFPELEEYRESLLDERVPLAAGIANLETLEEADPVQLLLAREEWERLSPAARNQLALDRYLARHKSDWEIGLFYERYVGYLREKAGYTVTYRGAIFRFEDMGQDLICKNASRTEIIQAKCWSTSKVIREKHVFQLLGSSLHYAHEHRGERVIPTLVTTTELSPIAKEAAALLDVQVEKVPLPATYPLIKCNISSTTRERIYHLPFDQMYDRTQIRFPGECFVTSVAEAEALGFRRAWRHHLAPAPAAL
jgi:hypothetical protein